jgi:uncharacterized membrane protein
MLNPKAIGAIIGFVLGLITVCLGAIEAFIVALFILGGWLIGKFWMGEIDLRDLYERFMISRGKGPRT